MCRTQLPPPPPQPTPPSQHKTWMPGEHGHNHVSNAEKRENVLVFCGIFCIEEENITRNIRPPRLHAALRFGGKEITQGRSLAKCGYLADARKCRTQLPTQDLDARRRTWTQSCIQRGKTRQSACFCSISGVEAENITRNKKKNTGIYGIFGNITKKSTQNRKKLDK